jgi:uncharacterized protein (DUF1330 family)
MAAYLICDVTVKNGEQLRNYLSKSETTLAKFGGKFLIQAGAVDVVEGDWNPKVIILVEFPSSEKAREWYHSADYAPALAIKPSAIDRAMIIVQGL